MRSTFNFTYRGKKSEPVPLNLKGQLVVQIEIEILSNGLVVDSIQCNGVQQDTADNFINCMAESYIYNLEHGVFQPDLQEVIHQNMSSFDEHRKKAEEQISRGASITKHRISL